MIGWKAVAGVLSLTLFGSQAHAIAPTQFEFFTPYDEPLVSDVDMFGNVVIAGVDGNGVPGEALIYVLDSSGHWNNTATLIADDSSDDDQFGLRVALTDGRAVIASRTAIYLFVKQSSGEWHQTDERTFKGADHVSELDWQGNTLVVGVLGGDYPNYAFVYDTSGATTLRKVDRIAPTDAVKTDNFGQSVAAYGSSVVVTAPGSDAGQGAAYLYTCGVSACTQQQKFFAGDGEPAASFGQSVDMNSSYVVIGAPYAECHGSWDTGDGTTQCGKAYVFTRSANHVVESQSLRLAEDQNFYALGHDLTLQGSRLLITTEPAGGPGMNSGGVLLYTLNSSGWSLADKLDIDDLSLSTSLIGQYAVVGGCAYRPYFGALNFYKLPATARSLSPR